MVAHWRSVDDRAMSGDNNNGGGGGLSTTWQGLAQLPQLLDEVKAGVRALQSLASTPAAAAATGSPLATAAIVALGIELVVFLAEAAEAIDHDIEAMHRTTQNYHANESDLTSAATTVLGVLDQLIGPPRPAVAPSNGTTRRVVNGTQDQVSQLVGAGGEW
jgi:hypothetical protein